MNPKVAAKRPSRPPQKQKGNLLVEVGRTIGSALGAAAAKAEQAREVTGKAASAAGAEIKQTAARAAEQLKRSIGAGVIAERSARKKARHVAPARKKAASGARKPSGRSRRRK
jgi:hypothetical protein